MSRQLSVAFLLLVAIETARSAAPIPVHYEPWTIDDVVHQEGVSEVRFSPDGRYLAWARLSPEKEKNEHISQIMRTDLKTGRQVQLTRGKESCTNPRWSPDGSLLAFLSSRPAPTKEKGKDEESKTQVWLLDVSGGEPWPLTQSSRDVSHFAWAGQDTIVFAAQEDAGRRESMLKDELKDSTAIVEDDDNEPPVRLFKVDMKTKKVTRLASNRDRIEQLAASADGRFVVALHARSLRYNYDNKTKPILLLHDLTTGKSTRVFSDPKLNVQAIRWAVDGSGFYVASERSSKPHLAQAGVMEVHFHHLKTGKESDLDLGWARGLTTQPWHDHRSGLVPVRGGFVALLADGVRFRLAHYRHKGSEVTRTWLQGEHVSNIFGIAVSADGKRIAYAHTTASRPPRWYQARIENGKIVEPKSFVSMNEHLNKRRKARVELVRWAGANGDRVEGLLYYPHDYQPGKRAPLVVQIHGGPASADRDCWDEDWAYSANLLCQGGAFVLRPNYHGSAGYGLEWLESIAHGKYLDLETVDIEKGVDAQIARGLVDEKKLALQGWSNGAILTNALIAKTTRYRAASSGAGTVEYFSDWASCEFGDAFDRFYLGKSPLEDPHLYIRKSPIYRYNRVRTPTIIFFGTEDRVVHPQQGWVQYRALQSLGKADVRFVQFPGEKHSLKKLSHRKRKLQEELAWFDRHLFGTTTTVDVALKEESPLAWLLKKQKAKKVGTRYGEVVNGVLVPETVRHGDIDIGRFEVTAAQYAAFDREYKVEPGKENMPAAGISFEKAKAYCLWLAKTTGRIYRLPTAKEAETLYEAGESGDNTLDAWAGYKVNPDDAASLRETIKKLPGGALLREVGRGRGVGKSELVFDLGGNVAEWTVGKDGKGVLRGGSADTPADVRGNGLESGPAYQGLRVVRE